jgi:hypothetical protein
MPVDGVKMVILKQDHDTFDVGIQSQKEQANAEH